MTTASATATTTVAAPVAIPPPDCADLLLPLLPALAAAAASSQPAGKVLPLLSPILRQRVQLLADAEPWLRLLCYDAAQASRLAELVRGPGLEPHPVSGEVEVDWSYDAETRFRRLDRETLQALVALPELGIAFRLVYCVNDPDGAADGWRVGEVTVADKPYSFVHFQGASTIAEAERQFRDAAGKSAMIRLSGEMNGAYKPPEPSFAAAAKNDGGDDDDDDDDYWGRYDATPARTPADKRSPAPGAATDASFLARPAPANAFRAPSAEDEYFARYDQVQPAMDNHDPDEEAAAARVMPPLGMGVGVGVPASSLAHPQPSEPAQRSGLLDGGGGGGGGGGGSGDSLAAELLHPRPESSASSNGSHTVARLEETAGKREASEFGVKQHVSRSIRSLYMLSRASGIDRDEFERMVKTELDVLAMMDGDDD